MSNKSVCISFATSNTGQDWTHAEQQLVLDAAQGWAPFLGYNVARCLVDDVEMDTRAIVFEKSSPDDLATLGLDPAWNYALVDEDRVLVNARNWNTGGESQYEHINDYRAYVIRHEMGHLFGFDHDERTCDGKDRTHASIMMQQSNGKNKLFNCKPSNVIMKKDLCVTPCLHDKGLCIAKA